MPPRRRRPAPGRAKPQQQGPSTRRPRVVYRTTPATFAAQRAQAGPRERIRDAPAVQHGAQLAKGDPTHLVMAEFLVALGIIVMRTIGQYEPTAGGTARGVIKPSKPGKLGPLPMLAATLIFYFVLSLLAIGGGTRAKVAAIAGLVYDLAMLLNSTTEMNKLTLHLADIGKGKASPGGGPGPGLGAYQSVLSGGFSPGPQAPFPPGKGNKCPADAPFDPKTKMCVPNIQPGIQPF